MLVTFLAGVLAESFVLSGFYKLRHARMSNEALAQFSLPTGVQRIAVPLGVFEVAVACALVDPALSRFAAAAAAGFLTLAISVIRSDRRRFIADCGCWSKAAMGAPKGAYVVRNLVLLFAASAVVVGRRSGSAAGVVALYLMGVPFSLFILELPGVAQVLQVYGITTRSRV